MSREVLVFGNKKFKIVIPDTAKLTFGPFSPPTSESKGYRQESDRRGTLRVYDGSEKNILAVFAGVDGFRDVRLGYMEEIAKEEGATIWKNDQNGYVREEKVSSQREWVVPTIPALPAGQVEEIELTDNDELPF
jgi:hypothetical protein